MQTRSVPLTRGRMLLFIACAVGLLAPGQAAEPQAASDNQAADPARFFQSRLAPLLARHCLECHNGSDKKGGLDLASGQAAAAGGDSGPVLAPGDPAGSLLWQRVESGEMPPDGAVLSPGELETIRDWITAGGARYELDIDPLQFTTDRRAGYDWWSLAPLAGSPLPQVTDQAWVINPIDRFVLARLEREGLHPAPAADRRTLYRRLSFDLTGLPPDPADVDAFAADPAGDAYARLVDRLLDSPHYGEQWARHWLDVARYGQSQGFERDRLRPNAWQYRDWVIRAFNDDMPFDQFIRLQLAGDVLAPDDPMAIIATGFLVAGPWDEVGQLQQSDAMRAVVRQDELEDLVSTTSQAFLGLTVHCARCHDHKFDPVSQVDYYRLAAALGGVSHGERPTLSPAGQQAADSRRREIAGQLTGLSAELAAIEQPARDAIGAEQADQPPVSPPEPLASWDFSLGLEDQVGSLHGTLHGGAQLVDGRLVLTGGEAHMSTPPIQQPLSAKTLEAWVALGNLDQSGGGVISLQTLDGSIFDAIVYAERQNRHWLPGSNGFTRTRDVGGTQEDRLGNLVHLAVVYTPEQTVTMYRDGLAYGQTYQAANLQTFAPGKAHVVLGMRHAPAGGNRMLVGEIARARLYDRALTGQEVAASAGVQSAVPLDAILARLSPTQRERRNQLVLAISRLEAQSALLAGGPAYAVLPKEPPVTHVLLRGDPRQPGRPVAPGGVAALAPASADFGLAADAPDDQRRIQLSRWITAADNPLPARVMANRLWHYHFGVGIVDTPNDLGFNGGRPSHPELLDWLAAELVRGGWSLKQLHRTILLSATYRQSSAGGPRGTAIDAANRLLWRKTPLRLEAEMVRDAILAVSGELNPTMGGPGFQDFRTFTFNSQFYEMTDPVGHAFHRRSIYRTWIRSGTSPLLDVLDCPDPSTTAPDRAVTTTPLQSLALLNSSFVLRMAQSFADRLQRELPGDPRRQVEQAYRLAYARTATSDEVDRAEQFVSRHGLAAFCRVVFNTNEFLYIQ